MATKAELEAELAQLKDQFSEMKASEPSRAGEAGNEDDEGTGPIELSETMVKDLVKEIETFATDKPLFALLAVFLVGYVIGRAR